MLAEQRLPPARRTLSIGGIHFNVTNTLALTILFGGSMGYAYFGVTKKNGLLLTAVVLPPGLASVVHQSLANMS